MNTSLTQLEETHLANRQWMASALAGEIYGPGRFPGWKDDLYGPSLKIDPSPGMVMKFEEFYAEVKGKSKNYYLPRRHVCKNGEEILKNEPPSKRYGVGMLFPREDEEETGTDAPIGDRSDLSEDISGVQVLLPEDSSKDEKEQSPKLLERGAKLASGLKSRDESSTDESETDALGLARLRRPRSMGITFVADLRFGPFKISVSAARYRSMEIFVQNKDDKNEKVKKKIWVRIPASAAFEINSFQEKGFRTTLDLKHEEIDGMPSISLMLDVRIRQVPGFVGTLPESARLITVTIVNDTKSGKRAKEEEILFQCRFTVSTQEDGSQALLPLPRATRGEDAEEQSLAMLYRNTRAFAMGHGCAGDWLAEEGKPFARMVIAEPLPIHETPPVTPDLVYPAFHAKAGQRLSIAMLPLANGGAGWMEPLDELAELYDEWITSQKALILDLSKVHQNAARLHVNAAEECSARIRRGIELIKNNQDAATAFRLTNEAILLQQITGAGNLREITYSNGRLTWSRQADLPSLAHPDANKRSWRAFQIAFLLMSLPGLWDSQDEDREVADLIWFPTGGGKTEAYLGATAFHLLARRLQDPDNHGTGVLMRYTLRLLTSQQFQRAAGLICAMEKIRIRENNLGHCNLGDMPFQIGIWVGGGTTPNTNSQSIAAFNDARTHGPKEYKHVLLRCPWCGSEMGPQRNSTGAQPKFNMLGLRSTGNGDARKICFHCPDPVCEFGNELPVAVVDEEIYKSPPSLIIGTVDKFAMLAWKHEGRSIFGINDQGIHENDPPGLIIQDELHLITGPLGSMVGLYEGVIEELCTKRSNLYSRVTRPKLIASTATTRASTRQIRDLYAREKTSIFPPPGLNADDSFFATYERFESGPEKGKVKPGRMYLGILARGYGSTLTVNVRVFSALLAAAKLIPDKERDPWYTLLVFYNALRELGADLTLFGADIPERLDDLRNRWSPGAERRFLNQVLELTGRLENSEIPDALKSLERRFPDAKKVVDACLASNIIEVGVDVPRLGLMAVSGQPKNTAQYIQATGRVGRKLPGFVAMVYNHRKSRDFSHFEHFRDYHERLYAQVEPSSVTPFTIQLLERALHGAFLVWIRNQIPIDQQDDPRDFQPTSSAARISLNEFGERMRKRIELLYKDDAVTRSQALKVFDRVLQQRSDEWSAVTFAGRVPYAVCWKNEDLSNQSADMPLLRFYGEACRPDWIPFVWPTPTSMRGVDAECPAAVVNSL